MTEPCRVSQLVTRDDLDGPLVGRPSLDRIDIQCHVELVALVRSRFIVVAWGLSEHAGGDVPTLPEHVRLAGSRRDAIQHLVIDVHVGRHVDGIDFDVTNPDVPRPDDRETVSETRRVGILVRVRPRVRVLVSPFVRARRAGDDRAQRDHHDRHEHSDAEKQMSAPGTPRRPRRLHDPHPSCARCERERISWKCALTGKKEISRVSLDG